MKYIIYNQPKTINGYEVVDEKKFLDMCNTDDGIDSDEIVLDVSCTQYAFLKENIPSNVLLISNLDGIQTDEQITKDFTNDIENNQFNENNTRHDQIEKEREISEHDINVDPMNFKNLLDSDSVISDQTVMNNKKEYDHLMYVFGSSKGGAGKSFTTVLCCYLYALAHPEKKIALLDYDIVDPQLGITLHDRSKDLLRFYKVYLNGDKSFESMKDLSGITDLHNFPKNITLYAGPIDTYIKNNEFWIDVLMNCYNNYDITFIDTGIDYMRTSAISNAYKVADKLFLVSSMSIKSVASVSTQIKRITGQINNPVFSKEDNLEDKIRLILTQVDKMAINLNNMIYDMFSDVRIVAQFPQINSKIQKAEFLCDYSDFNDKVYNEVVNDILDS